MTFYRHYEDLECAETDAVIERRLDNDAEVKLPYGKFMERLLLMKKRRDADPKRVGFYPKLIPRAERMLTDIKFESNNKNGLCKFQTCVSFSGSHWNRPWS